MLRESLKRQIDTLDDDQLSVVAKLLTSLKNQTQPLTTHVPLWQRSTSPERAEELYQWISSLPQAGPSLPDEAFDRGSLYE